MSVAYSYDGKRIAGGAIDGTVTVFDLTTGKHGSVLQQISNAHEMPVRSISFSPDPRSQMLFSASDDGTVKMFDAREGQWQLCSLSSTLQLCPLSSTLFLNCFLWGGTLEDTVVGRLASPYGGGGGASSLSSFEDALSIQFMLTCPIYADAITFLRAPCWNGYWARVLGALR